MGGHMCKSRVKPEWVRAYQLSCREYSVDFKGFDDNLKLGAERVIKAAEDGMTERGLSLDFLKEVISSLASKDEHFQNLILKNKKYIQGSKTVRELVDAYKQLNTETKKFYEELKDRLEKARDNQTLLESALELARKALASLPPSKESYTKCKEKLAEFKKAEEPFKNKISLLLETICAQHEQIMEKLNEKEKNLAKKRKWFRACRKISCIIFAAAFATVFICSVVAAALTAPPLVVVAVATSSIPIGSLGEWVDSLFAKYENKMKGQRKVIDTMQQSISGGLVELNELTKEVEEMESINGSILTNVEFCCEDEDNLQVAVEKISEKQQKFKDLVKLPQSSKDQIEKLQVAVQNISLMQQSSNHKIDRLLDHMKRCRWQISENRVQVFLKNDRSI